MAKSPGIVEVAVPSPLYRSFDYLVTEPFRQRLVAGQRVLVSFGRRKLVAIVLALKNHSAFDHNKLKPVLDILDPEAVLDAQLLQLIKWASQYYQHPIGDALFTALPVLLRKPDAPTISHNLVWELTDEGRQVDTATLQRAPRQASVLMKLNAAGAELGREELSVSRSVLLTLENKGWIKCHAASLMSPAAPNRLTHPPALTAAQQLAIETIQQTSGQFQTYLLEGVTGSGKTEVYLQLIEPLLSQGRQVLILVPEIGLTPQLVDRFQQRFGVNIAVLHSGLNDARRLSAWQNASSGRTPLVLGTRSAIFTPIPRLSLIVVDEEHDASLKQQDGFRYSARDLAIWRARQLDIPVILGSATPALESLHNARQQRYRHLLLPERAGPALHPKMQLLDIRQQGMKGLLSAPLLQRMVSHLKKQGQVLLFLNRRGYSPVLLCHDCGWVAECKRCDARLTLHQRYNELRCHHCGSQRAVDRFCPQCGSSELISIGEGTERIEAALQDHFPQHPVLRIDRDTTRRKGQLENALETARSGAARILLGTQMLAKGHHFPQVTLVAVLDADQGLFSNDFRASERMAQLIIQVAGRAGRAEKSGEVIIQTHHPDHPLLRQLIEHGYSAFAEEALQEREQTLLPPFSRLALLRAEATASQAPGDFLDEALQLAKPIAGNTVQLWGPVAAPMERRAGRYRMQLMLQSAHRATLQQLLRRWLPAVEKLKSARKVRWSIDVDPVDLF